MPGWCSRCNGSGWLPFIPRWGQVISCSKCAEGHVLLPCLCGCGAQKLSPLDPAVPGPVWGLRYDVRHKATGIPRAFAETWWKGHGAARAERGAATG